MIRRRCARRTSPSMSRSPPRCINLTKKSAHSPSGTQRVLGWAAPTSSDCVNAYEYFQYKIKYSQSYPDYKE